MVVSKNHENEAALKDTLKGFSQQITAIKVVLKLILVNVLLEVLQFLARSLL